MNIPKVIRSEEWASEADMIDYRSEWPGELLVERATWADHASHRELDGTTIAEPKSIWFRFWLAEEEQVVEKYFNEDGEAKGIHIPICMPIQRRGQQYSTVDLILGLWIDATGRVLVLREEEFDQAVTDGIVSPVEIEQAERSIRKMTTAVAQKQFPPTLVRNFALNLAETPECKAD